MITHFYAVEVQIPTFKMLSFPAALDLDITRKNMNICD